MVVPGLLHSALHIACAIEDLYFRSKKSLADLQKTGMGELPGQMHDLLLFS